MKLYKSLFIALSMLSMSAAFADDNELQESYNTRTSVLVGEFELGGDYPNTESFDCSDRIVVIVEGDNITSDRVIYPSVEWIGPDGNMHEKVEITAGVNSKGKSEFYAFIQFNKGKGANLFSFMNPAMTIEHFLGDWEVRVNLNGRIVSKSAFSVMC